MKYLVMFLFGCMLFRTADAQVERENEKKVWKFVSQSFTRSNYKVSDNARESLTAREDYYVDKGISIIDFGQGVSTLSIEPYINSNTSSLSKTDNYKTQNNATEALTIRERYHFYKGIDIDEYDSSLHY